MVSDELILLPTVGLCNGCYETNCYEPEFMKHGHTTAFVMDDGSNNMTAVVEMKVMDDTISVDGKKTYVFVDTLHLVKNTRNSMKNNGFLDGDGNKISWSYVQKLEAFNSSQFPRYRPGLTHNHEYLQAFKEMNVAKAAYVSKLLYNIRD